MGLGAIEAVEHLLRRECPPTCVNREALPAFLERLRHGPWSCPARSRGVVRGAAA